MCIIYPKKITINCMIHGPDTHINNNDEWSKMNFLQKQNEQKTIMNRNEKRILRF